MKILNFDPKTAVLSVTLPQGESGQNLVNQVRKEARELTASKVTHGKNVVIDGRITGAMCLALGHELAHICKSVSIAAPMEGGAILCISH